jgi:hypothetical protein
MKLHQLTGFLAWVVLFVSQSVHAEDIIMTRSVLAFPEAMLVLQESIAAHGYSVSTSD